MEREREREREDLLEKLRGESWPEESLAAQPKALLGCSTSGDFAILIFSFVTRRKQLYMKELEYYGNA